MHISPTSPNFHRLPPRRRSIEVEYFTALIEKTRRDDLAALRRPADRVTDAASARLVAALAAQWGPDAQFDELNCAIEAVSSTRLWEALAPFGFRWRRPQLDKGAERRIERWLIVTAGRELGGLRLRRNAIGWCRIEAVGGGRA